MASEAQIAANKQNAQHSTGPKTPEGKKKTARNAFRHGLCAQDVCGPGELIDELACLVSDLIEEYQPKTRTEAILVERMAMAYHHAKRALRSQVNTFERCQQGPPDESLRLLHRYHKDHDRGFMLALEEVRRTQAMRRKAIEAGETPLQTLEYEELVLPNYSTYPEIGFVSENKISNPSKTPVTEKPRQFSASNQSLSKIQAKNSDFFVQHEGSNHDHSNEALDAQERNHLEQPPGALIARSHRLSDEKRKRLHNLPIKAG